MKAQVQVALIVATVLYLVWGIGLLLAPDRAHALLTAGPHDTATTGLFGASLLGFAALFLIAAREPVRPLVRACALSMLVLGLMVGYQMFFAHSMHQAPVPAASLIIDLGLGFYLLVSLAEGLYSGPRPRARRRMRAGRRMAVRRA